MLIKILTNLCIMRIVNIILYAPETLVNPNMSEHGGQAMYQNTQTREEHDSIDALVALQLLEEQEQTEEQEFFRLTGEIQQFGFQGPELETELPNLLNTRRERALYEALITLIRVPQRPHLAQMHQYGNGGSVEREFRGLF